MDLSRRAAVAGLIGSGVAGALGVSRSEAQVGQIRDYGVPYLGVQTPRQNCEQWCWAASIATIFGALGRVVPQEEIVRRVFPSAPCRPALDNEMLNAVAQRYTDNNGNRFRGAYFHALTPTTHPMNFAWWDVVKTELMSARPLLAAYRTGPVSGHAVVITHIRMRARQGMPDDLLEMTVRDPWPYASNRRVLQRHELQELRFVAAVSARAI